MPRNEAILRCAAMDPPLWLEPFDEPFRSALQPWLEPFDERRLACFDADGTLWSEDLGEAFLRELIADGTLPRIAGVDDVYAEYESRVLWDRARGYMWAVQAMAGLGEADVMRRARQLAAAWPTCRPAMAGLIAGLCEWGYEVWIVSASNRWVVEAAAPLMRVAPDRVIAMQVEVERGVLTDRPILPRVCRMGKVEAIRQRCRNTPCLAFGDSVGDLEMLESAAQAFVVGRRDQPGATFPDLARERGWPLHLF